MNHFLARRILVTGRVQGVGFRPFVSRIAHELGLSGWVRNRSGEVEIHVEGPSGEAKVWLDPAVELAEDHGLGARDLRAALRAIREHEREIRAAWNEHFGG